MNDFTELWDRLQVEENCCGVLGPHDYTQLNRSFPSSCCSSPGSLMMIHSMDAAVVARKPYAAPVVFRTTTTHMNESTTVVVTADVNKTRDGGGGGGGNSLSHILAMAPAARQEVVRNITPLCQTVRQLGCAEHINSWLKSSADILFVLGYCVIAFLKLSFLGILRYEIREMIQKIKLLQTEMANALCSDSEQAGNNTVRK